TTGCQNERMSMNFPQWPALRLSVRGALCILFGICGLFASRVSAQPLPMPANPSPEDGLTASAVNPVLRWTAGSENLLLNGGVEGGLGLGWEIASEDAIPVSLTDGSPTSAPAYAGAVSAWVPPVRRIGQVSLIQRVHLPIAAEHLALSWAAYLRALANPINTAEFRVEVR